MGRKKKSFIDKKNSSSFTLLHRSQRDVADDVLVEQSEGDVSKNAGMVLWPAPNNSVETNRAVLFSAPATSDDNDKLRGDGSSKDKKADSVPTSQTMSEWKQRLASVGLLATEDHDRYLKPITGEGTFLHANGKLGAAAANRGLGDGPPTLSEQQKQEEMLLLEVDRQFESLPLTTECMDDDVAQALFGEFEEGDFEELNDDFVLDAAQEPVLPEDPTAASSDTDNGFDFDAHVRQLMEKARKERTGEGGAGLSEGHDWGQKDNTFFSHLKPLHEQDDEDDEDGYYNYDLEGYSQTEGAPGVVSTLSPDEERALCDKFMETLAEYDSDEVGECPEEEIRGPRQMEGDKELEAALDDFLFEKEDEIFMQGTRHYYGEEEKKRTGGSGFATLEGKSVLSKAATDPLSEPAPPVREIIAQANEVLSKPPQKPPPEDVLIDGKSYFSERERNPWDCESILSTYSNLDNNPVTIDAGGRRRRRKGKNKAIAPNAGLDEEEAVQQIQLSRKTGLPLGVLPSGKNRDDEIGDDTYVSVNRGEARNKKETPEEKKARKEAIKMQRQLARIRKKATREVYQEVMQKRAVEVTDDVAGKTVFRYS